MDLIEIHNEIRDTLQQILNKGITEDNLESAYQMLAWNQAIRKIIKMHDADQLIIQELKDEIERLK